jgi:hypothetical protein
MKGILFSSDFVVDNNGNERLLEINTDTAFLNNALPLIDFTSFFGILSSNNITEVSVVYKDELHSNFVNHLSQSLSESAPFITTFTKNIVELNSIFPTIPEDGDNKFILRLAYDETAVVDSEYAKGKLELLKLFVDNEETGSVCNFYHSSTVDGTYNTLDGTINDNNSIPDFVVKKKLEQKQQGAFYKVGKSELSSEARINEFIASQAAEGDMIQQYHFNSSSVSSNNKITSIRSFNIIYGANLDIIPLLDYKIESIFDLPTNLSTEIDNGVINNLLSPKHYYEFATNFTKQPQRTKGGLLGTHEVIMEDDSLTQMQNLIVGDRVKSYFINGSPMRDNVEEVFNWENGGSTLPTGSYTTSSFVENIFSSDVENNIINELKIGGDTIYASVSNTFLVYQTDTDSIVFKKSLKIDPSVDLLVDNSGNNVTIDENNLYILNEDTHKIVEIDVEDVDTYLIAGTDNIINTSFIITHNWCFLAGTKITLSDNSLKNIEDVIVGENVLTYNEETGINEPGVVGDLKKHEVSSIIKLTFDGEKTIVTTNEHPFFVKDKGWVKANELQSNDICKTDLLEDIKILSVEILEETHTVYNLLSVSDHHNFYANNILVHNK